VSPGIEKDVLLVTAEEATRFAVTEVSKNGSKAFTHLITCRDLTEAGSRLASTEVSLALIDLDPSPLASLSSLEVLVAQFPKTKFIVLCREASNEVLLEAMQIGARHCLIKSLIADELPSVLHRMLANGQAAVVDGRLVSVFTASGGAGGTTIAINLAEELRQRSHQPVLLIDMDAHYGAVAPYLGLEGGFGVADLLGHTGAIDAQLVKSTAQEYAEDFQVLLSPASVNFSEPEPMPYGRLSEVLMAARHAFSDTVVDASRLPMDATAELASASVLALIVFQLSVIDVRTTRSIVSALIDRGVPRESILPVANRCDKRPSMLRFEDACDVLRDGPITQLSNDYQSAIRSVNYGQPLAKAAPRSQLRRDIQELAARVEAGQGRKEPTEGRGKS